MFEGKIKVYNEERGFGFIKDANSAQEFFVHVSGLIDQITENDEVVFELAEGPKGFSAVQVKKK